jgi:uncharacterized membrane protein YuzA (DUF378 family)
MRFTCILCTFLLITVGVCGGIFAFTNCNVLLFLCLQSDVIYRSFLGIVGVAGLFMLYALLVLRPFKRLR